MVWVFYVRKGGESDGIFVGFYVVFCDFFLEFYIWFDFEEFFEIDFLGFVWCGFKYEVVKFGVEDGNCFSIVF